MYKIFLGADGVRIDNGDRIHFFRELSPDTFQYYLIDKFSGVNMIRGMNFSEVTSFIESKVFAYPCELVDGIFDSVMPNHVKGLLAEVSC